MFNSSRRVYCFFINRYKWGPERCIFPLDIALNLSEMRELFKINCLKIVGPIPIWFSLFSRKFSDVLTNVFTEVICANFIKLTIWKWLTQLYFDFLSSVGSLAMCWRENEDQSESVTRKQRHWTHLDREELKQHLPDRLHYPRYQRLCWLLCDLFLSRTPWHLPVNHLK